jgi:glycosyltransferase involved in cell wall biosynthesis
LVSKNETWGLAINEAMASCKPILVSDKCGAANELVDIGRNGYIFKAGDEFDLIQKMECMLQSDLLEMGRNAQQKIKNFSYESFLYAVEQLLN